MRSLSREERLRKHGAEQQSADRTLTQKIQFNSDIFMTESSSALADAGLRPANANALLLAHYAMQTLTLSHPLSDGAIALRHNDRILTPRSPIKQFSHKGARSLFRGGIVPRNTDYFLARFRRANVPIPKESPNQGEQ
jgi:hypothetical protein